MNTSSDTLAQDALERLATLEDTFENYSDGIAILDGSGSFVMGNKRYSEMFFDEGQKPRAGDSEVVAEIQTSC